MTQLSIEQINEMLDGWGLLSAVRAAVDDSVFIDLPSSRPGSAFMIPSDARINMIAASRIVGWMRSRSAIFWIPIRLAYGYDDVFEVFDLFLHTGGFPDSISAKPGILFDLTNTTDRWQAIQLLHMMSIFMWEGWIFTGREKPILWVADEVIEWSTYTDAENQELVLLLSDLGLDFRIPEWHRMRGSYR